MHDGKRPLEVTAGGQMVVAYSAQRQAQMIGLALAGLLLAMAALNWWRKPASRGQLVAHAALIQVMNRRPPRAA